MFAETVVRMEDPPRLHFRWRVISGCVRYSLAWLNCCCGQKRKKKKKVVTGHIPPQSPTLQITELGLSILQKQPSKLAATTLTWLTL